MITASEFAKSYLKAHPKALYPEVKAAGEKAGVKVPGVCMRWARSPAPALKLKVMQKVKAPVKRQGKPSGAILERIKGLLGERRRIDRTLQRLDALLR